MAQIRKFENAGKIEEAKPMYQKIVADGLGEIDPEELKTKLALDPDKWFQLTGANPKHRDAVITRVMEILDMSKEHGLKVDPSGTYTFNNPLEGDKGINDKYKSDGKFNKKGLFGLGGVKDDDNTINNLAYYAIDKMIRGGGGGESKPALVASSSRDNAAYLAEIDLRAQTARQIAQQTAQTAPTQYKTAEPEKANMGGVNWDNFIDTGVFGGGKRNLEAFRKAYATEPERFGKVKSLVDAELAKYGDPEWDKKYNWSGAGTKNDYVQKLQNLSGALSGNVYNDDVYKSMFESGSADYLEPFLNSKFGQATPATAPEVAAAEPEPEVEAQPNVPTVGISDTTPEPANPQHLSLEQIATGDLSAADSVELGSMALDLVSIISGYVPVVGASVVSAAGGATASIGQFTADMMRPETSLGSNIGSLAFNLGMDFVSLAPYLGTSAKLAAKTPKMLMKLIPWLSKSLLAAGVPGAWQTVLKVKAILEDPSRNLSELDMQDARNLTTVLAIGNYAKNAASTTKSKSLETKNTFEVEHPNTKKKTKVELTQAQADKVKEQKTPETRKAALKTIVDEKVQAGELAPEFVNATPVVDKFKLKVWESAPIKGKAVTTKKVEVDNGYKHNTDDASAWSRYLAKTREANLKMLMPKQMKAEAEAKAGGTAPAGTPAGEPAAGANPANAANPNATQAAAVKAKRTEISTRIIDTRKQMTATEAEIADINKQIDASVHDVGKPDYNTKMNALARKEVELETKMADLRHKLDVDTKAHAALAPKKPEPQKLSPEAETAVKEALIKAQNLKVVAKTKNYIEGIPKNRERAEVKAQQEKLDKEFLNRAKTGAAARVYQKTGSMFGGTPKPATTVTPKLKATATKQYSELSKKADTLDAKLAEEINKAGTPGHDQRLKTLYDEEKKLVEEMKKLKLIIDGTPFQGSSFTSTPAAKPDQLQRHIPFENPNLPSGLYSGTWYHKQGGKILKGQTGLQVPYGLSYSNNSEYGRQSQTGNKTYGGIENDLDKRLKFYKDMLPEWVIKDLDNNGYSDSKNVLNFLNNYNKLVDADVQYFKDRGWADQGFLDFANNNKFTTTGNAVSSADGKMGQWSTTRPIFQRQAVTPAQQAQLKAIGVTRAQQALTNPQARTILGEELFNDLTKDLDKNPNVDFLLGAIDPGLGNAASPGSIATRSSAEGSAAALAAAKARTAQAVARAIGDKSKVTPEEKKWDAVPIMKTLEAGLGIMGNNALKAPKETGFMDPMELHSPVYGDLQTRSMYETQAAKIRRKMNTPISSDPALQAARQIEGEVQGNDAAAKGWLADSNMIKQSGDRSLSMQIESLKSRNQAAMYNKEKMSRNNVAEQTLQNQKTLANFGILQNMAKEAKNELMVHREDVRDAEIRNGQMNNVLDYQAKQKQLDADATQRTANIKKIEGDTASANQEIAALDKNDANYATKLKALNDRIAYNNSLVKADQDYLTGGEIGQDNYFTKMIGYNRDLSTADFDLYQKAKADNRWIKGPLQGWLGIRKDGGVLNFTSRNIARNLTPDGDSTQKAMNELSKLYKDIIKKIQ